MESPVALEIDHQSVLLGWKAVLGVLAYELQMQTTSTESTSEEQQGDIFVVHDPLLHSLIHLTC